MRPDGGITSCGGDRKLDFSASFRWLQQSNWRRSTNALTPNCRGSLWVRVFGQHYWAVLAPFREFSLQVWVSVLLYVFILDLFSIADLDRYIIPRYCNPATYRCDYPPVPASGPSGKARQRRNQIAFAKMQCPANQEACTLAGSTGFECVDTMVSRATCHPESRYQVKSRLTLSLVLSFSSLISVQHRTLWKLRWIGLH